jgi:SAM-dependent methyltransferase
MQPQLRALAEFYDAPMGQIARRQVMRRIRRLWPSARRQRVLGFGFATPYLRPFLSESERVLAFMPEQLGEIAWPAARPLTVLGEEACLPFPDAMFDRILLIHGLEITESVRPLMRQLWRVLAPEGRLLIVAPNRASLWAQIERSPFAQGRPFLRAQLEALLRDAMFNPERWDGALYHPPLKSRGLIRSGESWERLGKGLWPRLCGVHLVEASKSVAGFIPVETRRRKLIPARA